ncbi:MAG: DUF4838 domain-containing protein, partial [Lentisphaerae bacterium]|nr:DUF4838 domain-containing protein [Lentisphaerota bacterium]
MKRIFYLAMMAVCVAGYIRAETPEQELIIVENGQSAYTIVVPDADDPGKRLGAAADLLRERLELTTGVKLPLVKESEFEGGPAIYLGRTEAARRAGLPVDEIKGWSFLQRVVGADLFLVGEDASAGIQGRESLGYQGTMRAVTVFLEDQVGVRFVLPGPRGAVNPQLERLAVPADLNVAWTPIFDYVIGRRARDDAYSIANHFFGQTPIVRTYGGHSYYTAVPAEKYGESNPEYFAFSGGARSSHGNHLCISNPEVQELMLQEMEGQLDLGYAWVELAQTDGYVACQCPACQALHPNIGERIWIVHRKLAEEMQKRRPGKKIMLLSYGQTGDPPLSFTNFPDNVVIQMTRYTPADFDAWRPFNVQKSVYIYNWGRARPHVSPRYAVDQVRLFADNGVRGIYLCGGLDQGLAAWGLFAPSYYAFGKALADPSRDADQLEREFIDAAFGEAAAPMRAFFHLMHRRLEVYALLDRVRTHKFDAMAGDFETHFFPPKVLNDMTHQLARAKEQIGKNHAARAEAENIRARVELVEAEFRYLHSVASVFHMYRAYRMLPNWTSFGLLEQKVREYQETLDWLFPDGKPRPADGLRAPFNGRKVGQGGVPFNWDFALLREQG